MKVERFEDLGIWQKARGLCKTVYEVSNRGAFAKDFPLRDQIRKASGSIMDNIAEAFERGGNRELIQFLAIAKGSAGEVRSQLYRAFDQEYFTPTEFDMLIEALLKISGGIANFMTYLKDSDLKGAKFKEPEVPYSSDPFEPLNP
jgi:four helix bundle protein